MKTLINQALDKNCNENRNNESKNEESSLAKQNRKVHHRQTILSEFSPKQVVEKLSDQQSKNNATVMINFRKLISQLLNAKVIIERLSQAAEKAKLYPKLQINLQRLKLNQLKPQHETKFVRRYCHKCKTMDTDNSTTKQKKCHKCGIDLLYVCTGCNENIYVNYKHAKRHQMSCRGQKKSNAQGTLITLRYCADCDFCTAYQVQMACHVSRMKHKVLGNEMIEGV